MSKRRGRPRKAGKRDDEPIVNSFAAQHGDYGSALIVDLSNELGGGRQKTYRVIRNLYPDIVDRWLAEGGPGFGEGERRAIEQCRALWHKLGYVGKLVANLDGVGGGHGGMERAIEHGECLAIMGSWEDKFGMPWVWDVFEQVVRNGEPAGRAGSKLGRNPPECIAHAKSCVGFVASKIAEWEGY